MRSIPSLRRLVQTVAQINKPGIPVKTSGHLDSRTLQALTLAGMAACMLSTIFELYHVDVFLHVYELPLHTYSFGRFVFSVISTGISLSGFWLVDFCERKVGLSELVGLSGCLFALSFLTPFFRWWTKSLTPWWDGFHFVTTMILYDSMQSITSFLLSFAVTDNYGMTDEDRVKNMASGQVINFMASFLVARVGLFVTASSINDHLQSFRVFLVALALLVSFVFLASKNIMEGKPLHQLGRKEQLLGILKFKFRNVSTSQPKVRLARAVHDLWTQKNFRVWMAMEILLEGQASFVLSFQMRFVHLLLYNAGVLKNYGNWLLACTRPLSNVLSILLYIPIKQYGYYQVYRAVFTFNLIHAGIMFFVEDHTGSLWILSYIIVYPALTEAIRTAGFQLAMADMVLEMKRKHALEGRTDEYSKTALLTAAATLVCKPMQSVLPIVAAGSFRKSTDVEPVYKLLVIPPLACSFLQLLVWSGYSLNPKSTKEMRTELISLQKLARAEAP